MSENSAKNQVVDAINKASNILVTVGRNPTVDELTAALGLTLALDKQKKHTSAIFSGQIPHIMKFLHPERTFENSTASFQDFIISLDKAKADKLRYKVEGDLVKIFITPYHTTLSPSDLMFSDGDLNIDLVIALGVKKQGDLDAAMAAHGKILHDATIVSINLNAGGAFGGIIWQDKKASGYSEIVADLVDGFENKIDKQIATALLTGIVISTEQFSNAKNSPHTMLLSSKLLSSGADQQLIVAEINGAALRDSGLVESTEIQDIPEIPPEASTVNSPETMPHDMEPTVYAPPPQAVATASEPALPPAEIEAIKSSLDPYLPPPLPDFAHEPLPPAPMPAAQPSLPAPPPQEPSPPMEATEPGTGLAKSLPPPPPSLVEDSAPITSVPTTNTSNPNDPAQFRIPT
ncbi:MAG: hypothetical protein LBC95_02060 [Candidatus Nomurabacteria bacterium]|jgi:hypothetical protein|nr:hypothetical protein [Candidatus Nomurabacteria bacterium]